MAGNFMRCDAAREWLRDAQGDFALASISKTRAIRYAHLCFHAQQAAEKALKAVYLAIGRDVPKTHDLAYLIDNLPANLNLPPALLMLPVLTKYAVQYRYPGQSISVTRRDWARAVDLAREACRWAKAMADSP